MPTGNGGITRKICKDLDIKVIDIAVNVDYVRLFVEYLPKYSVGFINKKRRNSRELHKAFPHIKEWCDKGLSGIPSRFHGSVCHGWEVVERYIQTPDAKMRLHWRCT